MGLDQYLYARKTFNCYDHAPPAEKTLGHAVATLSSIPPTRDTKWVDTKVQVGYWRKANAIHGWFVRNCAEGEDDCEPVAVPREKLVELRDLCKMVLETARTAPGKVCVGRQCTPEGWTDILEDGTVVENADEIAALLPPTQGFFFGSYDIGQYFLGDCRETVEILDRALALPEDVEFEYLASW